MTSVIQGGFSMSRQLNKGLFHDEKKLIPSHPSSETMSDEVASELSYQIKLLKSQLHELSKKQREIDAKTSHIESNITDIFSKSQQNLKRFESAVKSSLQSMINKFSRLNTKVTERNLNENKVQAIIDRHNHVLQQFEQRSLKLQKIISEQEMQLINYKSTIHELQKKHYL